MKIVTFVTWVNVRVPNKVKLKDLYLNHLISDKVEVWNGQEILNNAEIVFYSTEDVLEGEDY